MTGRRVVVIGGGYGGATVAKALDEVADVVLVEPREAFIHNVATLRAVVDPDWIDRLFIPYDGLLSRGRVVRDRAVMVSAHRITLAGGESLDADHLVLATGSTHSWPAKIGLDEVDPAKAKLRETQQELAAASHVLLLGAGPVGLELAGEIRAAWPETRVTLISPRPELVPGGFPADFRAELRRQLDALDVELLMGTTLREPPSIPVGHVEPFTVMTQDGTKIEADAWFACYGAAPVTDYLADDLAGARGPGGLLTVTPELRVVGHDSVYAIGDVIDLPELKMGRLAQKHAEVVAANITAAIDGTARTVTYTPEPDAIVLPLGPHGGVSYAPEAGVLGATVTAEIKANLYLDLYRDLLGASS